MAQGGGQSGGQSGSSGGTQLATAFLGATLGGLGAFFGAREQKKAFRRFRKRQSLAIEDARKFADERVASILDSPLIKLSREFVEGTLRDPGSSPLAEGLRKSLRVAQEARGLRRSTAGAVAEASSLAGFQQQLRAQLLPQAQQLGVLPEQLRQSIIGFEAPLRIAQATGLNFTGFGTAPGLEAGFAGGGSLSSILSQSAQGFLGGAQAGAAFQNNLAQQRREAELLDLIRSQRNSASAGGRTNALFQTNDASTFGTPFESVGGGSDPFSGSNFFGRGVGLSLNASIDALRGRFRQSTGFG
jgi:hypothetical protein